jgi:hypothetical protein
MGFIHATDTTDARLGLGIIDGTLVGPRLAGTDREGNHKGQGDNTHEIH